METLFYLIFLSSTLATPVFQTPPQAPVIITAEISAYTAEVAQTDLDPETMASGKKVYLGAIACPRLYPFGTKVEILGKTYTCDDRMNIRYTNTFDIFMWDRAEALQFGRRKLEIKIYQLIKK